MNGESSKAPPARLVLREYLESLIVAIIVAVFLRVFVVSAYKIPTSSMVPSLMAGDFVFAYKLPYGIPIPFSETKLNANLPARGDVVVFRLPGNEAVNYVKRVVALPGEKVELKDKRLFINDVEATYEATGEQIISSLPGHEYYAVAREKVGDPDSQSTHLVMNRRKEVEAGAAADSFGPMVVPPGHIFVLGDNRDSSDDSRYWGSVPAKNLEGRVFLVWLSLNWLERWGNDRIPEVRWERIFQRVQ